MLSPEKIVASSLPVTKSLRLPLLFLIRLPHPCRAIVPFVWDDGGSQFRLHHLPIPQSCFSPTFSPSHVCLQPYAPCPMPYALCSPSHLPNFFLSTFRSFFIFSHSKFDVGRSMFDVHLFSSFHTSPSPHPSVLPFSHLLIFPTSQLPSFPPFRILPRHSPAL